MPMTLDEDICVPPTFDVLSHLDTMKQKKFQQI
jgi:hypothetical protein